MSAEQIATKQESAPESKQTWVWWLVGGGCVLLACCVLIAVLAGAFFMLSPQTGQVFSTITTEVPSLPQTPLATQQPFVPGSGNVDLPEPRQHPMAESNRMGDPNAPVKIIEYADFQCPYCVRYWQDTETQIIENYVVTGKVFYEYRSMGEFIGPESAAAAEAAYCAGAQNKFWEYHDILYANWSGENVGDFTDAKLRAFAAALGLDQNAFDQCMSSGKFADRVQQDAANAKAAGINGTPAFLINDQLLQGAQPYSDFEQAIEAALQGN